MKRWPWLALGLVLSIGINVGLVASRVLDRPQTPTAAPAGPAATPTPAAARMASWSAALADGLRLEGERRERFVAIQQRFAEAVDKGRKDRMRAQVDLRRALLRRHPEEAEVDRLLRRLAECHAALDRAFAENVLASRAMLGPLEERGFLEALQRLRMGAAERRALRRGER